MKNLTLNPNMNIKKLMVPGTKLYVYIIDDFLLDMTSVMNFAHNIAYFHPMFADNSYYPGVRDNMPQPYLRLLQAFFEGNILPDITNKSDYAVVVHKCLLSLIACKPANLLIDQKIPHIDSCDERDYAFVHYLSDKDLGGTSIYKYTPEDIIEFKQSDKPLLTAMVNNAKQKNAEHKGYIVDTTSLFEQVLKIEAKFNRLVIYQGNLLHSANITSTNSYCKDTKVGRLSIASFASIKPVI